MKKWLHTTSFLSLLALGCVPAWAVGAPDIASSDPFAPRILLPEWTVEALPDDIDPWVRRSVAAREVAAGSGDALLESVAMQMLDRYDVSDLSEEEKAQRFLAIASGEAAADYEKSHISEDAVRFSKDSFDGFAEEIPLAVPAGRDEAAKAETDAAFLAFLASPDGMKTLSMMSGDQISAIATLVSAMRSDIPADQLFGRPAATLDGVPELSSDPSATDVAALVKSITEPTEPEIPEVRDVGDGTNLLLAGWTARVNDAGDVEIYNPNIEGSALSVVEGMVLGAFGPVEAISQNGNTVSVQFSNGETIGNIDNDLNEGVPALALAAGDQSGSSGEFLMSALPDVPAGAETGKTDPATSDAGTVSAEDGKTQGLVSSLRPKPRPASFTSQTATASASAEDTGPVRPRPRPADLVVASSDPAASQAAPTRSLRPQPRPDTLSTQNGGT